MTSVYDRYLKKLEIGRRKPSLDALKEIISAQLKNIPFENISKLYYFKKYGAINIPDFETYIKGMSDYNFGGTCYSTNYYLNQLLDYLGYDVRLCGADMKNPDVHMVNVVNIEGQDFLIDAGYAAPFLEPIPLNIAGGYKIDYGPDSYILSPKNNKGLYEMQFFQKGELKHGYSLKPFGRNFVEFRDAINDSFKESSTFRNSILLTRFEKNFSVVIRNFVVTKMNGSNINKISVTDKNMLAEQIVINFAIPKEIVKEVLDNTVIKGSAFD